MGETTTRHHSESRELLRCNVCGTEVGAREEIYAFDEDGVLCGECALERGGSYDADEDRWIREPDVSDLTSCER